MSGAHLLLFVSVGMGAAALGSWLISRRSGLDLQPPTPTQPREVQPTNRPAAGAPEDRRAAPEPPEPVAPGPSDAQTAICASAPASTWLARPNAPEVRGNLSSANAEKPAEADRCPDLEPAQAPKSNFCDEEADACSTASIEAVGAVPEPIEILDVGVSRVWRRQHMARIVLRKRHLR
jgi:hypothetical protein